MSSEKAEDTTTFNDFFSKEDVKLREIIVSNEPNKENVPIWTGPPTIPNVEVAEEAQLNDEWRKLRSFFRSGKNGNLDKHTSYSALLAPFRNVPQAQSEYPFWLADENSLKEDETEVYCSSLKELLEKAIGSSAEEDEEKRISSDVEKIVEMTREKLNGQPQLFSKTISAVLDELEAKHGLKGDERKAYSDDLNKMKKNLPATGVLIPFGTSSSFQILGASIVADHGARTKEFVYKVSKLGADLSDMIGLEVEKRPEGKTEKKLKSDYSFANEFFKFDEFASVLPESGSELMDEDRKTRIEKIIKDLSLAEKVLANNANVLVQKELYQNKSIDWKNIFDGSNCKEVAKGSAFKEVQDAFDATMKEVTEVIKAKKSAELQTHGKYVPEIYDEYFSNFDWTSFSEEEIAACPITLLIVDAASIVDSELSALSHMLSTNAPIKIIAVNMGNTNFKMNGSSNKSDFIYRKELAAMVAAHRKTMAMQITPLTPTVLFNDFSSCTASLSPALINLILPNESDKMDAFLWTSAAVESREFPCFSYDGERSKKWSSRFDISSNPQLTTNWPVHEIDLKGKEILSLSFTFADFAAQDTSCESQFYIVEPEYWTENLIALPDYLNLPEDEILSKIPHIWMVDKFNELQKVAVSWSMVLACKERMDSWNYLQENCGINNFHVEEALNNTRGEIEAEVNIKLESLKEEHAKEIEAVKSDTAGEAMEKLTAMLLDLDTNAILTSAPQPTSAASPEVSEAAEPEVAEEEPVEEDDSSSYEEAWIETPLCTSCNECTDINGALFKYNEDKMAFIADHDGGTFAEIVEAAEKCPVSIIHPGSPKNTSEPDIENLMKIAEKFN